MSAQEDLVEMLSMLAEDSPAAAATTMALFAEIKKAIDGDQGRWDAVHHMFGSLLSIFLEGIGESLLHNKRPTMHQAQAFATVMMIIDCVLAAVNPDAEATN